MKRSLSVLLLVLVCFGIRTQAQENIVMLGLLVNEEVAISIQARQLLDQFETDHPGIQVEMISNENRYIPAPNSADDIQRYLENVRSAVTSADVVAVSSNWLLPEATAAGYFLDLNPLVQQDEQLAMDTVIPGIWETVQWDGRTWAMPVTYDLTALLYDAAYFDEVGLPYPDDAWTLSDLVTANELLVSQDTRFYLNVGDINGLAFFRAFLDTSLKDTSTIPSILDFTDPSLIDVVDALEAMSASGFVVMPEQFGYDYQSAMMVSYVSDLNFVTNRDIRVAMLPNSIGLQFNGFAVSGATAYPTESYELLRFLSRYPEFVDHQGLGTVLDQSPWQETTDLVNSLMPLARPWPEYHFMSYLSQVVTQVRSGVATDQALAAVEYALNSELIRLNENAESLVLEVAQPPRRVVSPPGEAILNFVVYTDLLPLPNQGDWQNLARRFADENPDVASVNIRIVFGQSSAEIINERDCFYSPDYDFFRHGYEELRAVDPLLQSDPVYNPGDYIPQVMDILTADGQIWGIPLNIQPYTMWVHRGMFEDAGAVYPVGAWMTSDFAQAVTVLQNTDRWLDDPVVVSYANQDIALLMLIASFGGLPIDTRYDPWAVRFTEQATIDAIRQVVTLISDGGLQYLPQTQSGTGIAPIIITDLTDANVRSGDLVMMVQDLNSLSVTGDQYEMIPFPEGDYTLIVYRVGSAFITQRTAHPELCYRFIRMVMDDPTLFSSMPVRWSLLDDPRLAITRTEEDITLYRQMADALTNEDAVVLASSSNSSVPLYVLQRWFRLAMDAIVLDSRSIEDTLEVVQERADIYLDCLGGETLSDAPFQIQEWDCAVRADPEFFTREDSR